MDPDENLREQLQLARSLLADHAHNPVHGADMFDAARLAELVIALDEWLAKKGFLPARWQR